MNGCNRARLWRTGLLAVWLCGSLAVAAPPPPEEITLPGVKPEGKLDERLPSPRPTEAGKEVKVDPSIEASLPQPAPTILPSEANAIDLACVLRLAGVENPEILIARQRVVGAEALRLLAYSQILPNINVGLNYDAHVGNLQQSDGHILNVNRNALYLGLGAGAIAAGTVNIPGIMWTGNVGAILFDALAARQTVRVREFENIAVRNQIFLQVANGYMELLRAESRRAIAVKNREEAHEVARLMAASAKLGRGNDADANRAAAEYAHRLDDVVDAERLMLTKSAALAALINVPPSVQLHAIEGWVLRAPGQIVPEPTPMRELLLIAINRRPELAARQAAIRVAMNELRKAKVLPFSPNIWGGLSAGTFGGGSNLVAQPGGYGGFSQSRFGSFAPRDDVDVILYWTAQNMGVGNFAQIRYAAAEKRISDLEYVRELNLVRADVARAYAGIHARFAQIGIAQAAVLAAGKAYEEDYKRIITTDKGLPIELLNSFRLLVQARYDYLDSVVNYDEAQFSMYVALGQPPAALLARPIPSDMPGGLVPPPQPAPPLPGCGSGSNGDGACAACNTCQQKP